MATYVEDCVTSPERVASSDDIKDMMVRKAHELFAVCDKETKGFITKRDMQRLQTELPLSPEQLEDVFDSLDDDRNGFLTLEEFTGGFGGFIGLEPSPLEKQVSVDSSSSMGAERVYENDHVDAQEVEENYQDMLANVGINKVLDDTEVIKSMWQRLRLDEPELLGHFEEFLHRITNELHSTRAEHQSLEFALRNKSSNHDEEVQKLYEEMELQIKLEKERILAEEKAKEKQLKDEMERELREKDAQLQELLSKHQEMEQKLSTLNSAETETKMENEKLAKEKIELEDMLDQSERSLEDSKHHMHTLRQQYRSEKRDRARSALQISEGIALERESLVKQLDMLRDMNRRLRDDKDEAELRRSIGTLQQELAQAMLASSVYNEDSADSEDEADAGSPSLSRNLSTSGSKRKSKRGSTRRKELTKQGSVMSSYFNSSREDASESGLAANGIEDDIEVDDYGMPGHVGAAGVMTSDLNGLRSTNALDNELTLRQGSRGAEDLGEFDSDGMGGAAAMGPKHTRRPQRNGLMTNDNFEKEISGESDFDQQLQRSAPVGANATMDHELREFSSRDLEAASPERVFKVVFVGDSGVGKSSFIHRFCNNTFKATFSATIGVDFQVKNVRVDNHVIALQLWDTAGQERFRSITKQYFRKADGVIIMYDVTSESSFKNIRNWMTSVQDGTEESTVLTLIGNKMDMVEEEDHRVVTTKDGSRLADDYGALFYETSAQSGLNVKEALHGMASLLREREDKEMENALNLAEKVDKKSSACCK